MLLLQIFLVTNPTSVQEDEGRECSFNKSLYRVLEEWRIIDSPDERGLWLAAGVSEVQNQRQVAVVDSDTGDIDDARDALLEAG